MGKNRLTIPINLLYLIEISIILNVFHKFREFKSEKKYVYSSKKACFKLLSFTMISTGMSLFLFQRKVNHRRKNVGT